MNSSTKHRITMAYWSVYIFCLRHGGSEVDDIKKHTKWVK